MRAFKTWRRVSESAIELWPGLAPCSTFPQVSLKEVSHLAPHGLAEDVVRAFLDEPGEVVLGVLHLVGTLDDRQTPAYFVDGTAGVLFAEVQMQGVGERSGPRFAEYRRSDRGRE